MQPSPRAAVTGNVYGEGLGSARIFVNADPGSSTPLPWTQQALLVGNDGEGNGNKWYGYSVDVDGDTALVGAYRLFPDNGVRAFTFVRTGTVWAQEAMLTLDDDILYNGALPGVAIEGDTAVVGLHTSQTDPMQWQSPGTGKAFVFERTAVGWGSPQVLTASGPKDGDRFGLSVSISGDSILVGADENVGDPFRTGFACVFVRGGDGAWTEQAKLLPPSSTGGDDVRGFGGSVAIQWDRAVVGSASNVAHVFVRDVAGVWSLERALAAPTPGLWCFACAVDLRGDVALIGSKDVAGVPTAHQFSLSDEVYTAHVGSAGSAPYSFGQGSVALSADANTVLITGHGEVGRTVGSVFVLDSFSDPPVSCNFAV